MTKPLKISLIGLAIAVTVVVGGIINTYLLNSNLKEVIASCVEERKTGDSEWELVCEPEHLSMESVGIQLQIAQASHEVKQSKEWPYIVAAGVISISIVPFLWYFLLARIRELHDAITGK